MAPLSMEPHNYSEPASRASVPAQLAPVRFSFRSAPRRYTVALAFLCLLVVVLVAVLVAIVVSRRGQPEVETLVAVEEMTARVLGPTYHLQGTRSLACRDAYVFACSAVETDLKCRQQYATVRPVPAADIIDVDDPKTNASTALAKARMFYRVCVEEGNASVAADLLRVAGVELPASPVGHEQLFSSVQGGFLLSKIICDASVPLFFRLGVRTASGSQPAIVTCRGKDG
ncbi:hypothetical protein IscW_ISCW012046 [Ixodes scapularis]|uniref:Uncharacterized protein n=1 Tax=Ixodes scapularis TaxID=6945 RepID=B7QAW1_IXOSC|nr:hypothetical protein IscW_ISCW012046 [Ixodes scapularis]|eukprot:XP_002412687.1 hypothetical protein IscW_ISCW012046 [Ixodes scapularis]